ncbi:MAG: DNA modification methylase [Spirochaetes bacterium]|nr:MAG: DNA modification methylase [Spirochaetota bacterium]
MIRFVPVASKNTARPSDLSTYHRNPRRGDVSVIAASLQAHGQYKPVVVNKGTYTGRPNEVLAGNHTLMAIRDLAEKHPDDKRWQEVLVHWIDVDDDRAARIVLVDNRASELGSFDPEVLFELVSGFSDELDGLGYTTADLADLERSIAPPPSINTDPDDAPPVPDDPISEVGQIWNLGPHRLLIGSATDESEVRRLVRDTAPDCVWTDPPYGVDYVGGTGLRILNDDAQGLRALLTEAFTVLRNVCRPGAPVYIAAPAGPQFADFAAAMADSGVEWRQTLVWVKNTMVLGRSDYHYRHEAVFYGFTPQGNAGAGRLGRGGDWWFGGNSQTTVFEVDRPQRNSEHPTMKPVALISAMLANSLPPGGTVLDPFSGSGSTLIAAHGRGARALCTELDPKYADVILRRFKEHTGIDPELDAS